jgi:hypothetical protein
LDGHHAEIAAEPFAAIKPTKCLNLISFFKRSADEFHRGLPQVCFLIATSPRHSECASATSAQLIQNWAVWAVITLTGVNEAAQHVNNRPMCFHAGRDGLLVALGQDSNFSARSLRIAPEPKQLTDLLDGETKASGALDEAQLVHVALVKDPVAIRAPAGRAQQSYAFVIPDQLS